jgi:hypothetical protein
MDSHARKSKIPCNDTHNRESSVSSQSQDDNRHYLYLGDADPDVIPLQFSGGTDMDLHQFRSRDFLNSGLMNLWDTGKEGPYLIRHGRLPVRDFGRPKKSEKEKLIEIPNLFERAYPCLYLYGVGGIEAPQPVEVDFTKHVRWAMQYCDRRFRRHSTFPCIVFSILQRRQALRSAQIQMRRQTFD